MTEQELQKFARRWAKGAVVIASLGLLFMIFFTADHFYFGEPIRDSNTGRILSDREILDATAMMCGGCGLFLGLGLWILRNPAHHLVMRYLRMMDSLSNFLFRR